MPFGWLTFGGFDRPALAQIPAPCQRKRRGVTQSPKRPKRRNRRKS
jgi:hypothetical protein